MKNISYSVLNKMVFVFAVIFTLMLVGVTTPTFASIKGSSKSSAISVKSGKVYTKTSTNGNKTFYKLTTSKNGYIECGLNVLSVTDSSGSAVSNGSADVYVFTQGNYIVKKLSVPVGQSFTSAKIGLSGNQTVFLVVKTNSNYLTSYSFKMTRKSSSSWETENNSTKSRANPVLPNKKYYGALMNVTDKDYFTYTASKDENLWFYVGGESDNSINTRVAVSVNGATKYSGTIRSKYNITNGIATLSVKSGARIVIRFDKGMSTNFYTLQVKSTTYNTAVAQVTGTDANGNTTITSAKKVLTYVGNYHSWYETNKSDGSVEYSIATTVCESDGTSSRTLGSCDSVSAFWDIYYNSNVTLVDERNNVIKVVSMREFLGV